MKKLNLNLHHEWPLTVFTVLAQCVIGAFTVFGVLSLCNLESNVRFFFPIQFILWCLLGLGFISSTFHLGSPKRAINALNRIGKSWLSNEIAAGSAFFALGGVYWLLGILGDTQNTTAKTLLVVAMLVSYFFLYAMIRVYKLRTSATWNNRYTGLSFLFTTLFSGLAFSVLLLALLPDRVAGLDLLTFMTIIAGCGVLIIQMGQLNTFSQANSGLLSGRDLVKKLNKFTLIRTTSTGISVILFAWCLASPHLVIGLLGFLFALFSELCGRDIFYRAQMSRGL